MSKSIPLEEGLQILQQCKQKHSHPSVELCIESHYCLMEQLFLRKEKLTDFERKKEEHSQEYQETKEEALQWKELLVGIVKIGSAIRPRIDRVAFLNACKQHLQTFQEDFEKKKKS